MSTKYKMVLSIGFPIAIQEETIDISDYGFSEEEWEALSEEDRETHLEEMLQEFCSNYIDASINKVED